MKIDFYVLETSSSQQAYFYACQLLEKIHLEQQQRVFIHMNTREDVERFDALLWTYRDDSFLPHAIHNQNENISTPIQIGYGSTPQTQNDVLMNFSSEIPEFYNNFNQVIEIVFNDPIVQQLARTRYKQYRDQGHDLNTIKIKASEHD